MRSQLLLAALLAAAATMAQADEPKGAPAQQDAATPTASGVGFVIPRNTCEQGTPLQVFKPKAPASMSRGSRAP